VGGDHESHHNDCPTHNGNAHISQLIQDDLLIAEAVHAEFEAFPQEDDDQDEDERNVPEPEDYPRRGVDDCPTVKGGRVNARRPPRYDEVNQTHDAGRKQPNARHDPSDCGRYDGAMRQPQYPDCDEKMEAEDYPSVPRNTSIFSISHMNLRKSKKLDYPSLLLGPVGGGVCSQSMKESSGFSTKTLGIKMCTAEPIAHILAKDTETKATVRTAT
jgi:hypothetical protein